MSGSASTRKVLPFVASVSLPTGANLLADRRFAICLGIRPYYGGVHLAAGRSALGEYGSTGGVRGTLAIALRDSAAPQVGGVSLSGVGHGVRRGVPAMALAAPKLCRLAGAGSGRPDGGQSMLGHARRDGFRRIRHLQSPALSTIDSLTWIPGRAAGVWACSFLGLFSLAGESHALSGARAGVRSGVADKR